MLLLLLLSTVVVTQAQESPGAQAGWSRHPVTLERFVELPTAIGVDFHQPARSLLVSVNFDTGQPHNFELVTRDRSHAQFTSVSGLQDEIYLAAVRREACEPPSGFVVGQVFTGTGRPGQIARILPDGSMMQTPWTTLPDETGTLRGGLFYDRFCVFGGNLIVATTARNMWLVNSAGVPTNGLPLARIPPVPGSIAPTLEGPTTVPNNPARFGPWAGKILVAAEGDQGIHSIDAQGNTAFMPFLPMGPRGPRENPESIQVVRANQDFFGIAFGPAASPTLSTLWRVSASQLAPFVGDILVASGPENIGAPPTRLWALHWNGHTFHSTLLAELPGDQHWEGTTMAPELRAAR
jgi:hypothetical protein